MLVQVQVSEQTNRCHTDWIKLSVRRDEPSVQNKAMDRHLPHTGEAARAGRAMFGLRYALEFNSMNRLPDR